MLGLNQTKVELMTHSAEWDKNAADTVDLLKSILKDAAADVQHIGSTSVIHIKAKPIIDIAVAAFSFDEIEKLLPNLEKAGFTRVFQKEVSNEIFLIGGDAANNFRTHHIHIVKNGGIEWDEYVAFRDYLNSHPDEAGRYEKVKTSLAEKYADDRQSYTKNKSQFVDGCVCKALMWTMLGKTVGIEPTACPPLSVVAGKKDRTGHPFPIAVFGWDGKSALSLPVNAFVLKPNGEALLAAFTDDKPSVDTIKTLDGCEKAYTELCR